MSETRRAVLKGSFGTKLSPPLWKNQLKERCMERLKQNRSAILQRLRSPDANISEEVKRLTSQKNIPPDRQPRRRTRHPVFTLQHEVTGVHLDQVKHAEEQQEDDHEQYSIEELVETGKLSADDYLELVHSLEEALETELCEEISDKGEQFAQEMIDFEEASLAAMLEGMEIGHSQQQFYSGHQYEIAHSTIDEEADEYYYYPEEPMSPNDICLLCPICKTNYLIEVTSESASQSQIQCVCGLKFSLQNDHVPPYSTSGALQFLQDRISSAFLRHRNNCSADPNFDVFTSTTEVPKDVFQITCSSCGHQGIVL